MKYAPLIILYLLLPVNIIPPVHCEEVIVLDSLIKEAKERNPEIKSAREKWLSERSKIVSSRTPPDPQLGIGSGSSGMNTLSISQSYPFPGKLSLKGKIARETSNIYYEIYRIKELGVISKLKKAYYELFYIDKAIQIYEENSELIKHYSKVAEQRYSVGKTQLVQVLRAQVELSKYLNMLATLQQDKEVIQVEINALLDRPLDSSPGVPVEPEERLLFEFSFEQLERMALEKSPELLAQKDDIERSKKLLNLARMTYLPDFTGSYKQIEQGNIDSNEIMLNFTFPLYFWKQINFVKEKKSNKNRAESDYESAKNRVLHDLKKFYVKVDTAGRLVKLYKTNIIPQAEQSLKVAEVAYEAEKVSFLGLIDIQRSLLDFKLEYYKSISDYEKNLAELERILGGEINE